jgi:hypothetical protein
LKEAKANYENALTAILRAPPPLMQVLSVVRHLSP